MGGYFGTDCRPCPSPYFEKYCTCTSRCNWSDDEQCHCIMTGRNVGPKVGVK